MNLKQIYFSLCFFSLHIIWLIWLLKKKKKKNRQILIIIFWTNFVKIIIL